MSKRDYLIGFDSTKSRALGFAHRLMRIQGAGEIAHQTTETGRQLIAARFEIGSDDNEELFLEIISKAPRGTRCLVFAAIAEVPDGETRSSIWDPTENVDLLEETRTRMEGTLDPAGDLWDGFPGIER